VLSGEVDRGQALPKFRHLQAQSKVTQINARMLRRNFFQIKNFEIQKFGAKDTRTNIAVLGFSIGIHKN